jgi:hypothetical protein
MTLFRRSLSLSTGGQTLSLDLNAAAPSCAKYFVGTRIKKKIKIKANEKKKKKTYQKRKCVSRDKVETLLTLHFGDKISAKELMIATFFRVCREKMFQKWQTRDIIQNLKITKEMRQIVLLVGLAASPLPTISSPTRCFFVSFFRLGDLTHGNARTHRRAGRLASD